MVGADGRRGARGRRRAPAAAPTLSAPSSTVPICTNRSPAFFCVSVTRNRTPSRSQHAGVADLAAGFAVERRLVEHDRAGLAGFAARSPPCRPAPAPRPRPRRSRSRSRGTRSRRAFSRSPNQTVSVAASPEPVQESRALARCCSIASSKASVSTRDAARAQRILGQIERKAVGVVEREGGLARRAVARRARASPRRGSQARAPASCGSGFPRACSVSAISASARCSSG